MLMGWCLVWGCGMFMLISVVVWLMVVGGVVCNVSGICIG